MEKNDNKVGQVEHSSKIDTAKNAYLELSVEEKVQFENWLRNNRKKIKATLGADQAPEANKKLNKEQKKYINKKYVDIQLRKKQELKKRTARKKSLIEIKKIENEVEKLFESEELELKEEVLRMINLASGKVYFSTLYRDKYHYLTMECHYRDAIYKFSLGSYTES